MREDDPARTNPGSPRLPPANWKLKETAMRRNQMENEKNGPPLIGFLIIGGFGIIVFSMIGLIVFFGHRLIT
jgi:hypothetical protein